MSALSSTFFPPSNRRRCVKGRPSYTETSDNFASSVVSNNHISDSFNQNDYSCLESAEPEDADEEPITIDLSAFLNENPLLAQQAFESAAENNVASAESSSQFRVTDCEIKPNDTAFNDAEVSKTDFTYASTAVTVSDSVESSAPSMFLANTLISDAQDSVKENFLSDPTKFPSIVVHDEPPKDITTFGKKSPIKKFAKAKPLGLSNPLKKYKNFMKIKDINKTSMKVFGKYPVVKCEKLDIENFVKTNNIKVTNWPLLSPIKNQNNKTFKNRVPNKKISLTKAALKPKLRKPINFSKYLINSNKGSSNKLSSILVDSLDAMTNPIVIKTDCWKPEITKTSTSMPTFFSSPVKSPPVIPKTFVGSILSHDVFNDNLKQAINYRTISPTYKIVGKRSGPIITSVNKVLNSPKTYKFIAPKPVQSQDISNNLPTFPKPVIEAAEEPISNEYTVIEPYVDDPTSPQKPKPILTVPVEFIPSPKKESILHSSVKIENDNSKNIDNSKTVKSDFLNGAIKQISTPSRLTKDTLVMKRQGITGRKFNNESDLNKNLTKVSVVIGKSESSEEGVNVLKAKNAVVDAMQSVFSSLHKVKKVKPRQIKKDPPKVFSPPSTPKTSAAYSSTLKDLFFGFSDNDFEDSFINTEDETNSKSSISSDILSPVKIHNESTDGVNSGIERKRNQRKFINTEDEINSLSSISNDIFCPVKILSENTKAVKLNGTKRKRNQRKSTFRSPNTSDTMSASECENENNKFGKFNSKNKVRKTCTPKTVFSSVDVTSVSDMFSESEKLDVLENTSVLSDLSGNINYSENNKDFDNKHTDSSYSFSSLENSVDIKSSDEIKKGTLNSKDKRHEISDIDLNEIPLSNESSLRNKNSNVRNLKTCTRTLRDRKYSSIEVHKLSDSSIKKISPSRNMNQKSSSLRGSINSKLKIQMKTPPRSTAKVKIKQKSSKPKDILQEINTITGGGLKVKKGSNKIEKESDSEKDLKNLSISCTDDSESNPPKTDLESNSSSVSTFPKHNGRPFSRKKTLKVSFKRSKKKSSSSLKMPLNSFTDVIENSVSTSSKSENNESLHSSFREGKAGKMETSCTEESIPETIASVSEHNTEIVEMEEKDIGSELISNSQESTVNPEASVVQVSLEHSDLSNSVSDLPTLSENQTSNLLCDTPNKSSEEFTSNSFISNCDEENEIAVSLKNSLEIFNISQNNSENSNFLSDQSLGISNITPENNLEICSTVDIIDSSGVADSEQNASISTLSDMHENLAPVIPEDNHEISESIQDNVGDSGNSRESELPTLDDAEFTEIVTSDDSEKINILTQMDNSELIINAISSENSEIINAVCSENSINAESSCNSEPINVASSDNSEQIDIIEGGPDSVSIENDTIANVEVIHKENIHARSENAVEKYIANTINCAENSIVDKAANIVDSPKNPVGSPIIDVDHATNLCQNFADKNNSISDTFDSEKIPILSENSTSNDVSNSNHSTPRKKCPKIKISFKNSGKNSPNSLKNWYVSETKQSDEEPHVKTEGLEDMPSESIDNNAENSQIETNSKRSSNIEGSDTAAHDHTITDEPDETIADGLDAKENSADISITSLDDESCEKESSMELVVVKSEPMDFEESNEITEGTSSSKSAVTSGKVAVKFEPDAKRGRGRSRLSLPAVSSDLMDEADVKPVIDITPKSKGKMKSAPTTPNLNKQSTKKKNYVPELVIVPFSMGWMREHVIRASGKDGHKRQSDIYYFTPDGTKLRSMPEIFVYLSKHSDIKLSKENFTFAKELIFRKPFEIERDAKQARSSSFTPKKAPTSTPGSKKKNTASKKAKNSTTLIACGQEQEMVLSDDSTSSSSRKKVVKRKSSSPSKEKSSSSNTIDQFLQTDFDSTGNKLLRPIRTAIKKVPFDNSEESKLPKKSKADLSSPSEFSKSVNSEYKNPVKKSPKKVSNLSCDLSQNELFTGQSARTTKKSSLIQNRLKVKLAPRKSDQLFQLRKPCSKFCNFSYCRIPSIRCCVCLCLFHEECIPFRPGIANMHLFACKPCVNRDRNSEVDYSAEPPQDIDTEILYPICNLEVNTDPSCIENFNKHFITFNPKFAPKFNNNMDPLQMQSAPKNITFPFSLTRNKCICFLEGKNRCLCSNPSNNKQLMYLSMPPQETNALKQLQSFVVVSKYGQLSSTSDTATSNPTLPGSQNYHTPLENDSNFKTFLFKPPIYDDNKIPESTNISSAIQSAQLLNIDTDENNSKLLSETVPSNDFSVNITANGINNDTTHQNICSDSPNVSVLQTLLQCNDAPCTTDSVSSDMKRKYDSTYNLDQEISSKKKKLDSSLQNENPVYPSEAAGFKMLLKPNSLNLPRSGLPSVQQVHPLTVPLSFYTNTPKLSTLSKSIAISPNLVNNSNQLLLQNTPTGPVVLRRIGWNLVSDMSKKICPVNYLSDPYQMKILPENSSKSTNDTGSNVNDIPLEGVRNERQNNGNIRDYSREGRRLIPNIAINTETVPQITAVPVVSVSPKQSKNCSQIVTSCWDISKFSQVYECLNLIFKFLNVCDLLRASLVCRSWKHLASQKFLWEQVSFSGMSVTDWKKCSRSLQRHGTKSLDMRGILDQDSIEAWEVFSKYINRFTEVKEIIFEKVPNFVIKDITDNLPQLKNLTCYCVTTVFTEPEIWSTPCELELSSLRYLGHLQRLKISSMGGIILNGRLLSLMPYLPNLTHVVLTGFKFHSYMNLECLSQQQQLISLELGDCFDIEPQIYRLLAKLANLRNLCLQNGGDINDKTMPEAVSKMSRLENLELMNFKVSCHLADILKNLEHLCYFSVWPDNRSEAAHVNFNAFSAISSCTNLTGICWGILTEDNDTAPNVLEMKNPSTDKSPLKRLTFEKLFKILVDSFPGKNVEMKCLSRNIWSEFCSSRNFL